MKSLFVRFVREDAGQDLIEYGLLVGIITVGAIAAITAIGPKVAAYFTDPRRATLVTVVRRTRAGRPALIHLSVNLIGAKVQMSTSQGAGHDSPERSRRSVIADDSGQDLIEYALLTAIIGISGLLILSTLSDDDGHGLQQLEYGRAERMAALPAAAGGVPVDAQGINMNSAHIVGLTIASLACVTDLRTRRIPNVLTFGAALAGLLYQFVSGGIDGLGHAALGWLVGAVIFILPFALGGLGGGDVKLLAALGAWLGPGDVALAVALYRSRRRRHGACRVGDIRISRHRHPECQVAPLSLARRRDRSRAGDHARAQWQAPSWRTRFRF